MATARSGLAHRTAHPEASAGHRTIHCSHPEASADYRTMPRINHVIYNLPRLHHVDVTYIPRLYHVYTALICRVLHHIHTHHSRRFLAPHSIESRFYLAVLGFFSRQRRSTAPCSPNFPHPILTTAFLSPRRTVVHTQNISTESRPALHEAAIESRPVCEWRYPGNERSPHSPPLGGEEGGT